MCVCVCVCVCVLVMYAFNWALTAFRSESYIGSATALPDTVNKNLWADFPNENQNKVGNR